MSGFSIELLEEGYRAVDPVSRVRFVVKRAPDDMPVTAPVAKDAKGVAPSPPSAAGAIVAPASSASTNVTEPKLPPAPTSSVPATASIAGPGKKSVPPRPMDKSNGPASQKKGLSVDTVVDQKPAGAAASAQQPAAAKTKSERPPPPSVAPPPSAMPVSVGTPTPGLPPVKVLTSREQNPTDASPLTYREYSFAVPAGTSEDAAVEVLRAQLKIVDSHLSAAKMGKLVNLAVFDVEFTGKPPSPPLATLTWKDWKGEPIVGYPRRGAAQKQVKPPSGTSPAAAVGPVSAPSSQIFPAPTSFPGGTIPQQPQQPRPGAIGAAPSTSPPGATPAPPVVATAAAASVPNPFTSTAPMIAPAVLPQQPAQPQPGSIPPPAATAPVITQQQHPGSVPPPPMLSPSQPPPAIGVVAPVAMFTPQQPGSIPPPGSMPPQAHGSIPPPPAFPPPQQAPVIHPSTPPPPQTTHSQPPPPQTTHSQPPPPQQPPASAASPAAQPSQPPPRRPSYPPGPDGMVRTPSGRFVRGRTTGDELITALFESMHDLHFLRDALDGGQFCLALATEVLPARAAIIHFFDVEKREWVIACTRGKDTGKLLTMRTPEQDDLLRDAARKRRAVVTANASAATAPRYQTLGGSRSMIIAPIMQAGRALGAIEIINPLDGMPFTEDEGNAMTYIAEQYAEYLGSRGIVLDRERIQSAASPRT